MPPFSDRKATSLVRASRSRVFECCFGQGGQRAAALESQQPTHWVDEELVL